MTKKLFIEAMTKFLLGVILVGVLIFLPAGTVAFINGWLLMGVLFVPMFIAGIVMMLKSPELLRKRLNAKEKENEQSVVIKLSGLMFVSGFVVAGLNYRFGWYMLPISVSLAGTLVFVLAYALYADVLRENVYLSRTIEVQENQKVIDTGLYAIVRHPMYSTTLLLFFMIPVILGSAFAVIIFLAYPFIIARRIKNEEYVLERDLKGYKEYKNKVRYRLIPFVW